MWTTVTLVLYAAVLAPAVVSVWRRPAVALYLFLVGLALHNLVMALLYGAGVRGGSLDVVLAWKETLLAVAVSRVLWDSWRLRRLPFRPGGVDILALGFAAVALVYAVLPQTLLGGEASSEGVLYGLRHALVPVVVYLLGRALVLSARDLRRLGSTLVVTAAAVAAFGLVDLYAVSVEWWRDSGAVGYFRNQLGFESHGPGGLPENFALNSDEGVFRRLISTFVSPLGTAFMLVVALLVVASPGWLARRRALVVPLLAILGMALLLTLTRSAIVALAAGLVVLAVARRRVWPIAAAAATIAAGVAFTFVFPAVTPETHFFPADLEYQERRARAEGGLPTGNTLLDPSEPSIRSHLTSLRDGLEAVIHHPQGYGLGNAGATARRFDERPLAGESNYTEIGVELGVAGLLLFVAWNVALLLALLRQARAARDVDVRWAAGALAAALAAVLTLAVQTDAYGVPWLAYCLWWLGGALVIPTTALVAARAAPSRSQHRPPSVEPA